MRFGLEVLLLFLRDNFNLRITILDLQFDIAPFWELFFVNLHLKFYNIKFGHLPKIGNFDYILK